MKNLWLLLIFLTGCAQSISPARQQQDVASLSQTFATLEQLRVEDYRNQDWCKNIAYRGGKFSNSPTRQTCNLFSGTPSAFDATAQQDFQTLAQAFQQTGVSLYFVSNLSYAKNGQLIQAEFHLANCSCYYVYSPNYQTLPEDIPAELLHTAINQDWYFVRQDPM